MLAQSSEASNLDQEQVQQKLYSWPSKKNAKCRAIKGNALAFIFKS